MNEKEKQFQKVVAQLKVSSNMREKIEFTEITLEEARREESKTDFVNPAYQPDSANEEQVDQGTGNYTKTIQRNESVNGSWETLARRAGTRSMWLFVIVTAVILTVTIGGSLITFIVQFVIQESSANRSGEMATAQYDGNGTLISLFTASPSVATSSFESTILGTPEVSAPTAPSRTSTPSPLCGGILQDPEGSFSTPRYPAQYPANLLCVWWIVVESGSVVQFKVDSLNIEGQSPCHFDRLDLHEETENGLHSHQIARLCGNVAPPTLNTNTSRLKVSFVSDSSVGGRGFTARYWMIAPSDRAE
ncbi:membrane frizzled-related protein-like [Heptranchias perlo]|uniref:membrane frizzled-related protein-like n=1 Tax=Heptranchias perlo TaxID=212740 RepID=UPI00355A314A